jgi:hypothetical protein
LLGALSSTSILGFGSPAFGSTPPQQAGCARRRLYLAQIQLLSFFWVLNADRQSASFTVQDVLCQDPEKWASFFLFEKKRTPKAIAILQVQRKFLTMKLRRNEEEALMKADRIKNMLCSRTVYSNFRFQCSV